MIFQGKTEENKSKIPKSAGNGLKVLLPYTHFIKFLASLWMAQLSVGSLMSEEDLIRTNTVTELKTEP